MVDRAADHADAAPRSLKQRQRDERAMLILDAAAEVFADKGYHEASIDEIAARVGIAKGTVYLHFPSKEDLVAALVEHQFISFLQMVDQVAQQPASARVRLEHILQRAYAGLNAHRTQLLIELNQSLGITKQLIASRETLREYAKQATAKITALLDDGKRSGEFDTTIPTPVMLSLFWSLLSPRAFEQLLRDKTLSPTELAALVSRIYFHGIQLPASTES